MRCLFVSSLCSNRIIKQIHEISKKNPGFAGLKFRYLLARGLKLNNINVVAFSVIPMSSALSKKKIWFNKSECNDGIIYKYVPFVNIAYLRQIMVFIYTFFYVLFWGLIERKDKFIVCDMLNVSLCSAVVVATKINRIKTVGVLTDMPGLMVARSEKSALPFVTRINKCYLSSFDSYVFLSEPMNEVVNKNKRPYVVIEGFSPDILPEQIKKSHKDQFIIMYAGGLHERYGLKILADAVEQISDNKVELRLYGDGPFVEYMNNNEYKKVKYCGILLNDEIINAELEADLLVNPRPTTEEFTKYSFPSKNIEYMASGTPMATTILPSMPKEYYPYVFLLEDETVDGYRKVIEEIMSLSSEELKNTGKKAQLFIQDNKTNIVQIRKMLNLINN